MSIFNGNGIDINDIMKKAMENDKNGGFKDEKGVNEFIDSNLSPEQAQKLRDVISDETKMRQILDSEAAQELLKKLTGGKNNGRF